MTHSSVERARRFHFLGGSIGLHHFCNFLVNKCVFDNIVGIRGMSLATVARVYEFVRGRICLELVLALALAGLPGARRGLAHHSFAAEYDRAKPVTLQGVLTKIEWENPHTWIWLDVKGDDGKVIHWAVEAATPNALIRAGWQKDSLKVGDSVKVEGYLAKDASKTAAARIVILPDGKRVFAGSADQLLFPPRLPNSSQK